MMGKFFSPHPPLRLSNNAQIYDKNLKATGKKDHHTPTMFQSACEQVFVRAFLDTRHAKSDGTFPVYIRVTYQMDMTKSPTFCLR